MSPMWLFSKSENMDKVKSLHEQKRLGLIAIDEAHLIYMYEWDGFREHYQQCETLPHATIQWDSRDGPDSHCNTRKFQ